MFSTDPLMLPRPDWPWLTKMDALNLLTILDVLLDIKHEIDFNQGSVKVPILAPAIRFRDLLPVDTIPARDFYLKNRWSSFKFLAEQQVVAGLKWKQGPHRWQSHVELTPNRPTLMDLLEKVQVEIKVRSQQDEAKPAGKSQANFWDILHPKVVELAIPRFMAGHFSDAVEACLKEINAMVKARAKERTGKEFDGADLMRNTFSPKNPIITLADLSTESGKNEQQGYMEIFAGTMTGIRNPKAHDNVVIDEKRTIHLLHLASLLMYKLDEAK